MLLDLINEFKHTGIDITERILENYKLKPGLYIKLNKDGQTETLLVTKKQQTTFETEALYEWLKPRDYYSNVITTNKSVEVKEKFFQTMYEVNKKYDSVRQVHSNNIYTFFIKDYSIKLKSLREAEDYRYNIAKYYTSFLDELSPLVKGYYNEEYANKVKGYQKLVYDKVEFILHSLENIKNKEKDIYVKVFIDAPLENYMHESNKYLNEKVFLDNAYNLKLKDGSVLGLPSNNISINNKKKYLVHHSTNFKYPFLVTKEKALEINRFFMWLLFINRKELFIPIFNKPAQLVQERENFNHYTPTHYIARTMSLGQAIITDYEFLPNYTNTLDRPFTLGNYLNKEKFIVQTTDKYGVLEGIIDKNLFNFQLSKNFYNYDLRPNSFISGKMITQLHIYRTAFLKWLRKNDASLVQNQIDEITYDLLLNNDYQLIKAATPELKNVIILTRFTNILNTRYSLIKYFKKEEQDLGQNIVTSFQSLSQKVHQRKDFTCDNDLEFYLAAGQLIYYYYSHSKAQNVNYNKILNSLINLSAKDLKTYVVHTLTKFSHEVNAFATKQNKLLGAVVAYPAEDSPIQLDVVLAGYVFDNLIYEKTEKGDQNEEE